MQYVSSGSERFDNVYDKQVTTYTFTSANPKVTYFAIYTVTTTYEMLTNYSAETSTQEYQGIATGRIRSEQHEMGGCKLCRRQQK